VNRTLINAPKPIIRLRYIIFKSLKIVLIGDTTILLSGGSKFGIIV